MDAFKLRDGLIADYRDYVESFIRIKDARIAQLVQDNLTRGQLWPQPLVQLNPAFESSRTIDDLVATGELHPECSKIFRVGKDRYSNESAGTVMRLYKHQETAITVASSGDHYILTTGTGSGKSLSFMIPIVDRVLRLGPSRGIRAIIVYPMNALANSQWNELQKFLSFGFPDGRGPVTFARYTGQESDQERDEILRNPPDILLTNYVMLELILTRPRESMLKCAEGGVNFIVLDELHTYRGRQGADVAMLVSRVRNRLGSKSIQCVGTSATLSSEGSLVDQKTKVAAAASEIFGSTVKSSSVISESLVRVSPVLSFEDVSARAEIKKFVESPHLDLPTGYDAFVQMPMASWIEDTLGVQEDKASGVLKRALPRSLTGADGIAQSLAELTTLAPEVCEAAVRRLLLGALKCEPSPITRMRPFAFRLHQFISRGDTVYTSLEDLEQRYLTTNGQRFVPGDREKVLYPLAFCRECGQEYVCVTRKEDDNGKMRYLPRTLNDRTEDLLAEPGFLYVNPQQPWPEDWDEVIGRLPDDWLTYINQRLTLRSDRKPLLPRHIVLGTSGEETDDGLACTVIPAPFRFCLCCGIAYGARQKNDFPKLATLASEGRSTATTVMSKSVVQKLRNEPELPDTSRKLLSFTDNRQDASLQAGHFNDFIEIGILRSGLYRAVRAAGSQGLGHEELALKVFNELELPFESYATDPNARFARRDGTQKAFREVLGYRLYNDLRRGWRITAPNLEQCGLLHIEYVSLSEICEAEDIWADKHSALVSASSECRQEICKVLLDYLRSNLAIKVDYLNAQRQEQLRQLSSQFLRDPWGIDETEKVNTSRVALPRTRSGEENDERNAVYLSSYSGFGQYLGRRDTFPNIGKSITRDDRQIIIQHLVAALEGELLVKVRDGDTQCGVASYQIPASAMIWMAGDGVHAYHDRIRIPRRPIDGGKTNPYFIKYYQQGAKDLLGFEAREHTAQVRSDERIKREERFRNAELPILYCSPTMELGVDIAELNVVNMRNVPPTPANYAQRSGRAGRSGQPAYVYTYCTTGSAHDQHFFRRPENMVSGSISPPAFDIANEDLIKAHVHAVWIAEAQMDLGRSLIDLLDVAGTVPTLGLAPHVYDALQNESFRVRTKGRIKEIFLPIMDKLVESDWYSDGWVDQVLVQIPQSFDQACNRWRELYSGALAQAQAQDKIIRDPARNHDDKRAAERLRREAEAQLKLLTEIDNLAQSDFYSYRYFASEGFLPGYSFPRLPISAFIPARNSRQTDEYLSRPRFLAVSEFGPGAIVYHEGSRYLIKRVVMPARDIDHGQVPITTSAKLCPHCGYLHHDRNNVADLCQHCRLPLDNGMPNLFRMQNVVTVRKDQINCDEEERMKLGYDVVSAIRFADCDGGQSCRVATVQNEGKDFARMKYGPSATLWRINLGWKRRTESTELGFVLDIEKGTWEKNPNEEDAEDPQAARTMRVIPFVEDHRNAIVIEMLLMHSIDPTDRLKYMATLQWALKRAIQMEYQLEDNELAAEPLPNRDKRSFILIYEAAEGGAGALRKLIDDKNALPALARTALVLCHFDPATGEDKRRSERSREDCEAACYDCLMSYGNQPDHPLLDRQLIRETLLTLANSTIEVSSAPVTRAQHLSELKSKCESSLEKEWLDFLESKSLRLPTAAQKYFPACETRPDFMYEDQFKAAIYVDGPYHDHPDRQARDRQQESMMEDKGFVVARFGYRDDWDNIVKRYPSLFGVAK